MAFESIDKCIQEQWKHIAILSLQPPYLCSQCCQLLSRLWHFVLNHNLLMNSYKNKQKEIRRMLTE